MTDSTSQLPATIDAQKPATVRLWPLWVALLIFLILFVVAGFAGWQHWHQFKTLQQQVTEVRADTGQLNDFFAQAGTQRSARLQSLEDKITDQRELIAEQQRQIDHNARTLLEAGHRTRTDWLLAEAEYLLRIANQRLVIEKDIRGAAAALESADQVLAESDDVGVFPVRKAIASELLSLKALTEVDRTGLYLKLEAAIDQVHGFTDAVLASDRLKSTLEQSQQAVSEETNPSEGALAAGWNRFKDTLSSAIVVRRLDEPVKPLLSPEQSAYARLNLQLMLEQAELAVLRGNQLLFQRSISKAREAMTTWYDQTNGEVRAVSDSLEELAGRNIDPELPDISQSLGLLKARLAGRVHAETPATETAGDAQ